MTEIQKIHVHKRGRRPESFFEYIIARFLSKPLVPLLIKAGIRQPNVISVFSFIMILFSSALLLQLKPESLLNRIIIAVTIELSFILDCSDGQVARALNKTSMFGGWLDKYLDRIGEMVLYTAIGYITWMRSGYIIYFILGFSTGFLFTYYSLIWALKDSVFLEELRSNEYDLKRYKINKEKGTSTAKRMLGKRFLKKNTFTDILSAVFFFLNIGMGERYFYPILFIILDKLHLMLIIVSVLFFIRSMNVTFILMKHIYKDNIGIKIE